MDAVTALPWHAAQWSALVARREAMPHALLLHGARGIGKRRLAEALAQFLLCESPRGDRVCGECGSCLLLAANTHPDLQRLVPAVELARNAPDEDEGDAVATAPAAKAGKPSREILIDQVRDIGEFLSLSAHRGGARVVLLAPADALNAPAANALLKLLEEPPTGAFFIAVTDRLDAVLPTILSRCVLLRVNVPTWQQALAWLREQGVDDAEVRLAECGGAPVGLERVDDPGALPGDQREALFALLRRGPRVSVSDVIGAVAKDQAVGASIRLLQRWGWDLLAERMGERVRYYPGERRTVAALARQVELEPLIDWLGELGQAQRASDHPLNARLVIERLLLRYAEVIAHRA